VESYRKSGGVRYLLGIDAGAALIKTIVSDENGNVASSAEVV
jgi:sugar (pentulose or hexulose) kinase